MPKVSPEHRARQRERIIEASRAAAGEKGLANVTMADIIAASGLSAGAIYGYFGGRDEIVAAVAQEVVGDRLDLMNEDLMRRPVPAPLDMVRRLMSRAPLDLIEQGLVLEIWASATRNPVMSALVHEQLARITAGFTGYLEAYLTDRGEPDAAAKAQAVAPAFVGLAQGYVVRVSMVGEQAVQPYLDALTALEDWLLPGPSVRDARGGPAHPDQVG